jgi:hypothetical protein
MTLPMLAAMSPASNADWQQRSLRHGCRARGRRCTWQSGGLVALVLMSFTNVTHLKHIKALIPVPT